MTTAIIIIAVVAVAAIAAFFLLRGRPAGGRGCAAVSDRSTTVWSPGTAATPRRPSASSAIG